MIKEAELIPIEDWDSFKAEWLAATPEERLEILVLHNARTAEITSELEKRR